MSSDLTIERPPGYVLDMHGAFIRRTDLSFADLERANLVQADAANAVFRGASFRDAVLTGTILEGADLREAKGLTVEQLAEAVIDETTRLPSYISREDLLRVKESA